MCDCALLGEAEGFVDSPGGQVPSDEQVEGRGELAEILGSLDLGKHAFGSGSFDQLDGLLQQRDASSFLPWSWMTLARLP